MTKSLKSIKNGNEKKATIRRRLAGKERGLGYWAAVDAAKKIDIYSNPVDVTPIPAPATESEE